MNPNLDRYDLSDWLIHFTRQIDTTHEDSPQDLQGSFGFNDLVESTVLSPFFLLRRILRQRQVVSTWSLRGGKPTVYGPHPAVCFTEMPLAAFLDASAARVARNEKVSQYAVLVNKAQAFSVGARPVIYGLSGTSAHATMLSDGTRRFSSDALPELEQYRYVAFNPGGTPDWSHEREWRWPNRRYSFFNDLAPPDEDTATYTSWRRWSSQREMDRADVDGLCLDDGSFRNAGFLVKSRSQADLLVHDILALTDSFRIDRDLFTFILTLDALPPSAELLDSPQVLQAIAKATIHLDPFYEQDLELGERLRRRFDEIARAVASKNPRTPGEPGGCWLWLQNNTHQLTRALMDAPENEERLQVSRSGRYLVRIPEFGDETGLSTRETLVREIADLVKAEFGAPATYFSVSMSDDPDGLPFYTDGGMEELFVNYAHRQDDF